MAQIKWTKEQLQAIQEKGSNILVAAAAGSGKTAVLVERIIDKIIEEKVDINKMLVVTFTNAAASEMREKILNAIYQKLEEEPENIQLQRQITLLGKASICTIHAFCLEVIHNHFYEIGMPSNFRIADTAEISLLKQDTLEDLFEQKYEENNKAFLELLEIYTTYRGDEALQELILTIYEFMQNSPFPEKWLQEKLQLLEENKEIDDFGKTIWGTILLKYAKEELEEAVQSLNAVETKMNGNIELAKFTQTIAEDKEKLEEILATIDSWENTYQKLNTLNFRKWPVDKKVTNEWKETAKEIRDKIKKQLKEGVQKLIYRSSSQTLEDFEIMTPILQKLSCLVLEFAKVFAERKKEKNCIDFNDIEHFALQILVKEEGKPTKIAQKYQEKFAEIAIDEYQDSNLVQEAILKSISRGNNIFMVGDVKQSIYKFRGARPELFLQKYESYPSKEEKLPEQDLKIQLFCNFRSRQNVLDFTNLVFEAIMSKELGDINYNENEYLNYGANYPEPEENGEITKKHAGIAEMLIIDLKEEEGITAFKTEEETQEEENEQERIEDEVLEARLVAKKVQELLQSDYQVYDRKKGYRPIQPKDIVILLRATSNLAPIYEKELTDLNLPVFSDSSGTYLETVEIETILAILKILDNPLQDIPLVVVARSMIGGFSDNDLIAIRLMDRNSSFYEAMLKARIGAEELLKNKIESLLKKLENWKEQEQYLSLGELIWQIYLDTGYYQYVGLLPNGAIRQANLKTLFEKAKQYESASYKGLFHFIHFIEKLKKQNGDLGQAKLIGENEDVIRIMSIHKSKGLEFPVVFLCSTQKRFNLQDLNDTILLHQDIGFGPMLIQLSKAIRYTTSAKEAIKLKMKQETLSEEERILYVALTRAKEKLFITGRSKDFQKEYQTKEQNLASYPIAENGNLKLDYKRIQKGRSYLDWLLEVYLLGKRTNIMLKGRKLSLQEIVTLTTYSKKELLKQLEKKEEQSSKDVKKQLEEIVKKQLPEKLEKQQKELEKILEWKYPYLVDTKLPTKMSVTKMKQEQIKLEEAKLRNNEIPIKRYQQEETDLQEAIEDFSSNKEKILLDKVPKFLQEEEKISNSHKGSLVHLCIQKLEEKREYTMQDIQWMLQELVDKEVITPKEAKAIDVDLLYRYTKSELYQELKKAKEVHKEQPFMIRLPASQIVQEAKEAKSEKTILVQGIIDLYYINQKEELILVDFKTDYVGDTQEEEQKIMKKYQVQLEIYKHALEQALNQKVVSAKLCLASKNWKQVAVF